MPPRHPPVSSPPRPAPALGPARRRLARLLVVAAIAVPALATACKKEPTRWDGVASATTSARPPEAPPKAEGKELNAYFPKDGEGGHARVFTAEKDGYAEAKLTKEGAEVALLTVSDADQPQKDKFKDAKDKLAGYPLTTFGKNQSMVLVADRWQVKVSSKTLDEAARKDLLGTFDLAGLAQKK